jgi:hypothetical protein
MEAKAMLKKLQASGYGEFPDSPLRTLQRTVRLWRMRIVQQLVYGADVPSGDQTEELPRAVETVRT